MVKLNNMKKSFFLVFVLLFIHIASYGQDFGPHTFNLVAKNSTSINFYYLKSKDHITPSKDVVLDDEIIDVDAFSIPIVHTFPLAGNLSQVFLTTNFGKLDGFVDIDDNRTEVVDVFGLLDATAMFRVGLLNMPALDLEQFLKRELEFQLSGIICITLPIGQYDQSRRVNLGGNRWAFKIGTPMVIPLNKNKKNIFQWGIVPSVTFFTNNTEPFTGDVKTQKPLFWLEQHLSYNFAKNFWASLNLDYQYGGEASVDGSSSGNVINTLGAGASMSYSPFTSFPLTFHLSYSKTWFNNMSDYLLQLGGSFAIPSKKDRQTLKDMQEKEE